MSKSGSPGGNHQWKPKFVYPKEGHGRSIGVVRLSKGALWNCPSYRYILFLGLSALAILILALFTSFAERYGSNPEGWKVTFRPSNWRGWSVIHSEATNQTEVNFYNSLDGVHLEYGSTRGELISDVHQFGPLRISKSWWRYSDTPRVGTNLIQPGMVLYDPRAQQKLGTVLRVDEWHSFTDRRDQPAVLVRTFWDRTNVWIPRNDMNELIFLR